MSNVQGDSGRFVEERRRMVNQHLERRGITDTRVLDAFLEVPREEFVPASRRDSAYDDRALPVGSGQTISQPYIVALMTQMLKVEPDDRVLEVGTGSGYQAAVLARLGARVFTVEALESLSENARGTLQKLELAENVEFKVGDGSRGWPEQAPFDRIVVTAAAPDVPPPLKEQLSGGGRLVAPVGSKNSQTLLALDKNVNGKFEENTSISCVFVPLRGKYGWDVKGN